MAKKTYRVPLEFEAESDEGARELAVALVVEMLPTGTAGIIVDELARKETYWCTLSPAED